MKLPSGVKILLILLFFCSCKWQKVDEKSGIPTSNKTDESIQTKEPETFQTDIVLMTFSEDSPRERRIFVAKDGDKRLIKFGDKAWLQIDKKIFLLDYRRKVFVESRETDKDTAFLTDSADSLSRMVILDFLSKRLDSKVQKLSTENGMSKYLVALENSNKSEIIISYDENKKLITEQEFFSVRNGDKKLLYKMQLQNLSFEVSPEKFELPKGFRKVKLEEF
ncbi:MAG: hypothetical protein D6687_12210 [Acidobacteria bacterium]|nr:MAG: hypothetical protein D6687_12210 [Acidobacteriota bacterium]